VSWSVFRRASVIVVAASLAAAGGRAAAQTSPYYDIGTGPVTIKMKSSGKHTFFSGPKQVSRGAELTVANVSNPARVGAHTFSLVQSHLVPKTRKQRRLCHLCSRIAAAHEYHPTTQKVAKPTVEAGKKGWDTPFGKKGDSWYVARKGRSQTRKVTAKVGTTLTYFCGVHPRMRGTIKVVK
jgi:hypothetical protein